MRRPYNTFILPVCVIIQMRFAIFTGYSIVPRRREPEAPESGTNLSNSPENYNS